MSGHSKWANIKHRKGAQDAKRGKIFTKILKEITVAAKMGGGDIDGNPRLRIAVGKAKENNVPKDNIERAIKKGTGELEGVDYVEYNYEGYGPGGVALLVEVMTDNKNRTGGEVRSIFTKTNGNMADAGAVAWIFERKGVVTVEGAKEEQVMDLAIENGAEDVESDSESVTLYCDTNDFESLNKAVAAKFTVSNAEITMVPKNSVKVEDVKTATQLLSLLEKLEDHDDVQNVYSNFDIDDEILAQIED